MRTAPDARPSALSHAAGIDLDAYRPDHVAERIRRALAREGMSDVRELARILRADRGARSRFRRSVAVSVSSLFRDPAQFELLERELAPRLLAGDRRLRVWSVGCADGAELYSVAMILERAGALDRSFLLGSDLLEENLEAARHGAYGDVYIPAHLRTSARWERRDVLRDGAPPGKWQLVLCRNLAIYLVAEAKRRLHEMLAGALAPGGILLVGRSERLLNPASLGLEVVAPHAYRRLP